MSDDPFSPEADPYRDDAPKLGRRELAAFFAVTATAASTVLSACAAPRRLACPSLPTDKERCEAKFCRYYRPR